MGVLLVERVMRSRPADGAPRMASSVNGHWLGAISNSELPPSLWNCADQLTIKARGTFLPVYKVSNEAASPTDGRISAPWRPSVAPVRDQEIHAQRQVLPRPSATAGFILAERVILHYHILNPTLEFRTPKNSMIGIGSEPGGAAFQELPVLTGELTAIFQAV